MTEIKFTTVSSQSAIQIVKRFEISEKIKRIKLFKIKDRVNNLKSMFSKREISDEQMEEHNYLMFKYDLMSPNELLIKECTSTPPIRGDGDCFSKLIKAALEKDPLSLEPPKYPCEK